MAADLVTIAGPFKTREEAEQTAKDTGDNCTAFGRDVPDAEGYYTGNTLWYVEQDRSRFSGRIFGYDAAEFMARQHKKPR